MHARLAAVVDMQIYGMLWGPYQTSVIVKLSVAAFFQAPDKYVEHILQASSIFMCDVRSEFELTTPTSCYTCADATDECTCRPALYRACRFPDNLSGNGGPHIEMTITRRDWLRV